MMRGAGGMSSLRKRRSPCQLADWMRKLWTWMLDSNWHKSRKTSKTMTIHDRHIHRLHQDEDEPPKPQKPPDSCDDVDPWKLEDLLDIGTGEPLFSKFTWEDWMMLELRFQLHVLVHGYKHCMNDPGRVCASLPQSVKLSNILLC